MAREEMKFISAFEGKPKDEVKVLAEEGRELFNRTGIVPENSPQSLAIAAMVRLEKEKKAGNWGRDRDHRGLGNDEEQAA